MSVDDNTVNLDEDMENDLREIKELVAENNKILRGMRRSATISRIWHIFYWLIILGTGVASYYYLQPYINSLTEAYKSMQTTKQNISNFPESIKNYFSGN